MSHGFRFSHCTVAFDYGDFDFRLKAGAFGEADILCIIVDTLVSAFDYNDSMPQKFPSGLDSCLFKQNVHLLVGEEAFRYGIFVPPDQLTPIVFLFRCKNRIIADLHFMHAPFQKIDLHLLYHTFLNFSSFMLTLSVFVLFFVFFHHLYSSIFYIYYFV